MFNSGQLPALKLPCETCTDVAVGLSISSMQYILEIEWDNLVYFLYSKGCGLGSLC